VLRAAADTSRERTLASTAGTSRESTLPFTAESTMAVTAAAESAAARDVLYPEHLFYLVDIPVHSDQVHSEIASHIAAVELCRYITRVQKDVKLPDVKPLMYLSPPIDGAIMTPPHWDGNGTQMSVHTVLFGQGCYNLVETWPMHLFGGPEGTRDRLFRQCLGLPPFAQAGALPHHNRYVFQTHPNVWHQEKEQELNSFGMQGVVEHVYPGELIILPPYTGTHTHTHTHISNVSLLC
jgi:hypothetical protein